MSNRYLQTADLLPAIGTVLRSVCDHPSNYSFGLDPRRRSPNGHPQRATPRSVSSRGTVGGDRSANKVLRPRFRAASPRKNRTVSCSSGRTELLWPLYSLLHRASAVRSYAVKWRVVKTSDFLMIFGSSHGDRSAAAFRVIPSTKPKMRALCRASSCEHASNARRIALTWVRTVGSERPNSTFIWCTLMPPSSNRKTSNWRGVSKGRVSRTASQRWVSPDASRAAPPSSRRLRSGGLPLAHERRVRVRPRPSGPWRLPPRPDLEETKPIEPIRCSPTCSGTHR